MKHVLLLVALASSGCASGRNVVAPVDRSSVPPAAPPVAPPADITTTPWAITKDPVASVTILEPCHATLDLFHFRILENVVMFDRTFARTATGVANPSMRYEQARGQWDGDGALHLKGYDIERGGGARERMTDLNYELRLDATGNLIGTRNGESIRLARAIMTRPDVDCGPPPE
jgi:hypothetical protein